MTDTLLETVDRSTIPQSVGDTTPHRQPITSTHGHADGQTPEGWPEAYRHKITTPEEALCVVQSGSRVYIGGGCGEPMVLAEYLAKRNGEVRNVEVVHILTSGHAPYIGPEMEKSFRVNALFIGSNVRKAVQAGKADFTPIFLDRKSTRLN